MRATRRLATLTLAATAGLGLAACSTTVRPTVSASPMTQHVSVAGHTGAAHTTASATTAPATTPGTPAEDTSAASNTPAPDTSGGDAPEPGYGVHGDEGLCQAEAGWYGDAGLALATASADGGHVYPDDVVRFLEQLRDAPTAHEDASPDLVSAASDLSYATDEVITEITAGADAAQAMGQLDDPFTTFADGCLAAGIQV